ncbi:MAG TPA: PKD domain-containing protein [Thermoguttaceae bacterium]|nr:PKD domain-containing protein [Thermoguttaceae bacterium]
MRRYRRPGYPLSPAAFRLCVAAAVVVGVTAVAGAEVIELEAKDTLTALEMDHGDELRFQLRDGRRFALVLEDTDAAIVERVTPGGIIYRFGARVRVDGQPMTLKRYVCSQECFYEPYVVDGVRIWLDTVRDVFDLIPIRYPRKGNLQCLPRKAARLAIQDAALRICPDEMHPWIDDERNRLDVGACYNGDDCYLGPYLGQACHVGMDVNHPKGNPLFAPIDFDTQAYFNSLATGHNNNRWRGVRRWPNGDVWALQTHHLIDLLVTERTPLASGARYATTAGVHVGSHEHTHFELKIGRKGGLSQFSRSENGTVPFVQDTDDPASIAVPIDFDDESPLAQERPEVLHLDPWIVFWQIFEDRKARTGEIRAAMKPLGPARAGEPVTFSADGSRPGSDRDRLALFWAFGDGGSGRGRAPSHVFARPGVYPVTLVVDDGARRASTTQHVSVGGDPVREPMLALAAPDELSFRPRPVHAMDVYGEPVRIVSHTLEFVARASRPVPRAKVVRLVNSAVGELAPASVPEIEYERGSGWLKLDGPVVRPPRLCTLGATAGLSSSAGSTVGQANRGTPQLDLDGPPGQKGRQSFEVSVDAAGLAPGTYSAWVEVSCPGAINSPQWFRVELRVPSDEPRRDVTVDDRDPGFSATPYFWVGHRFSRCPADKRGHGGFYLTCGGRTTPGQFARFTPDLQAGRYEVSLSDATPFSPGVEFDVRVRHAEGDQRVRVRPDQSRRIGTFEFHEGTDGFVQILAEGSHGLVIADAVIFRRR